MKANAVAAAAAGGR
ncbi:hypothetical protein, partial [Shigella flexneri]